MNDLNRQRPARQVTELYRHFDAAGKLLYVGISLSTAVRLASHKTNSRWARQIASITIERFPTRAAALAAERAAIETEHPVYNKAFNAPHQPKFRVTINLSNMVTDPVPPKESPLERYFRERGYKTKATA